MVIHVAVPSDRGMLTDSAYNTRQATVKSLQKERRVLNLAAVGLSEVPVFGHYHYHAARPGLTTHKHRRIVEICYLERGYQTYRAAGREYRLSGGDVFVTAP